MNKTEDSYSQTWKNLEKDIWNERKKKKFVNFQKFRREIGKLTKMYKKEMIAHVKTYEEEFKKFFTNNSKDIMGFDIEEMNGEIFCIMWIIIRPDLSVWVEGIYCKTFPCKEETKAMMDLFAHKMEAYNGSAVVAHGFNKKEATMISNTKGSAQNSQLILEWAQHQQDGEDLKGTGLKHFEKLISFERRACDFLKHDHPLKMRVFIQAFFNLFGICVNRYVDHQPQRVCEICEKPQDIFWYCLEDAFSSLLIYVYYQNRGWE